MIGVAVVDKTPQVSQGLSAVMGELLIVDNWRGCETNDMLEANQGLKVTLHVSHQVRKVPD